MRISARCMKRVVNHVVKRVKGVPVPSRVDGTGTPFAPGHGAKGVWAVAFGGSDLARVNGAAAPTIAEVIEHFQANPR